MARLRLYPTGEQEQQMLLHCAHARYVGNLAVEQHLHWYRGRKAAPGFAEQCRQLTEARTASEWPRKGNADVQQQALKDFGKAKQARFTSGFGEPTWRRKYRHEGFRVIGTDRVPEFDTDGGPKPSAKTGRQIMGRSVVVQKLNRRWAQVKVPGCGWVGFRLTRTELPQAKTFRVTWKNGQRRAARAPKNSLYDLVRFEKLNIKNMTRSAKGTIEEPGKRVAQKAGLNRAILAQGWGLLRQRTEHKAPGRVEDVPAPYTILRCSACGWIDKNSRKSQAEFVCSSCGFTCNADTNAAVNVAAGQDGESRPGRQARAGGTTPPRQRSSVREPQPTSVGIPLFKRERMSHAGLRQGSRGVRRQQGR
ncbi:RNA-guided endonuclease InsQ/TnpB family protein [Streptomyces sp. NPDC020794]|uniref:RNA-guided endonuclease InsQ/TnpB family protein n=1 Tax=unclassified Streptomyces TaxID=2593676 RepID=UPI0036E3AB07